VRWETQPRMLWDVQEQMNEDHELVYEMSGIANLVRTAWE
jgi:hypothetical protein